VALRQHKSRGEFRRGVIETLSRALRGGEKWNGSWVAPGGFGSAGNLQYDHRTFAISIPKKQKASPKTGLSAMRVRLVFAIGVVRPRTFSGVLAHFDLDGARVAAGRRGGKSSSGSSS